MQVTPVGEFMLVEPLGGQAPHPEAPLTVVFGAVITPGPDAPYQKDQIVVFRPQMGLVTPVTLEGQPFYLIAPVAVIATCDKYEDQTETKSGILLPGNVSPLRRG